MRGWASLLVPLMLVLGACGVEPAGRTQVEVSSRGDAQVGGEIVSTVDGHPITLDEVADAARGAGVPPAVALARLQDELLLANAATHAGHARDDEARRARVHALLEREVEARVQGEGIDPSSLEAARLEQSERFERPERRTSVHVLARIDSGADPSVEAAAARWIQGIRGELEAAQNQPAQNPEALALAMRRRSHDGLPFEVLVEEVGALGRAGAADPAYLAALFESDELGPTSAPVRSTFGWHAVVRTSIEPAWRASADEAVETLRTERLAVLRAERLASFVQELSARTEINVDRQVAERALRDPGLVEGPR